MKHIKKTDRYESVSLNVNFMKVIDNYIKDKPQYRSRADFVRISIVNQMNKEY